ncbi:hypothetical protein [Phaffia rhodozyma]|uniref:Uncharacterized protein n=1 Tax=Phaffia rhodozyma TaxID=264483 RepID=A0A0F7SKJ7_PHARH|nr:hypothetical protein [Phaffia rhodozyma]
MWTFDGNVNEVGDAGRGPGKSSLFSFTAYHPEIGLSGARVQWWVEPVNFDGSAGLQGEQPLVDRTM